MTEFFKVSGSGNDFLALVEPDETPNAEAIRAWCQRGVSVGGDGLFVLRRLRRRLPGAPPVVAMDYYNADGYAADLCLNGTRCAAQLAFHLEWAENSLTIETGAGAVTARRRDQTRVTVELSAPERPEALTVDAGGIRCAGYRAQVGVPHFVLPWPEGLDRAPVASLGREIRHLPLFEQGTNVNFVRFPDEHRMEIRTYERGVEAETLSCGSGVLAGAAVGLVLGRSVLPLRVLVQSGFELEVGSEGASWLLSGDARVVARGTLLQGAAAVPSPPAWF